MESGGGYEKNFAFAEPQHFWLMQMGKITNLLSILNCIATLFGFFWLAVAKNEGAPLVNCFWRTCFGKLW